MSDEYKRLEDPAQLFRELNDKFGANLQLSLQNGSPLLVAAEKRARSIAEFQLLVVRSPSITKTQIEISRIFTEVFADIVCSIYLAAAGLDRPAQCILRRAFELGISITYLWDLPHAYYGWKVHDKDLNFTDMLSHLDSLEYRTFLRTIDPKYSGSSLVMSSELQRIYRNLSNTIHGKIVTFEILLPERYSYSPKDWEDHLALVLSIEDALIALYKGRFTGSTV